MYVVVHHHRRLSDVVFDLRPCDDGLVNPRPFDDAADDDDLRRARPSRLSLAAADDDGLRRLIDPVTSPGVCDDDDGDAGCSSRPRDLASSSRPSCISRVRHRPLLVSP